MELVFDTYEEWFMVVSRIWTQNHRVRETERYGQFLYNRMPNRFLSHVPRGIDPFNREENVVAFLSWLESHWNHKFTNLD